MFRSMNSEGQSSSSMASGTSIVLDSQESSWIGLLSRPALSLLRRLRLWSAAPPDFSSSLPGGENDFLTELNAFLPLTQTGPPHLTVMRCQQHGTTGLLEPGTGSSVPWLTTETLRDVGPQNPGPGDTELCQQTQVRFLSPVRTVLNQVLLNPQDPQPTGGKAWMSVSPPVRRGSAGKGGPWWGSLLWEEESSLGGLQAELFLPEGGTGTDQLCPGAAAGTTSAPVETSPVLEWMLGENSGPPNNKSLHTVQNMEGGQDLGYSSLEEELSQRDLRSLMRVPGEEQSQQGPHIPEMEEGQRTLEEDQCGGATVSAPQCQNKTIAFIMGCPCSDDSQSESTDDDDDDDGFNSEGSSDLSDLSDEEEDDEDEEVSDSDSEPDSDSERLWTSFCQTVDPYNPQNFTAHLQTGRTPPQTSLSPSPQSSPSPLTSSPPPQDVWDDSTSASEADEAESLRLLSSLSCSSDPYSPFNFQAPLRTHGPPRPAKTRVRSSTAPLTQVHDPTCPPEYKEEEADERLDSGFSEALPSASSSASPAQSCNKFKKVRFCDDVDEFFASCGEEEEDRHGPWEELARDRCRFLRRCEEVEQSIGFCLQPQHRRRVFQRLVVLSDS